MVCTTFLILGRVWRRIPDMVSCACATGPTLSARLPLSRNTGTKLLRRLKDRNIAGAHAHRIAGAGVPGLPRLTGANFEGTKASDLDVLTPGKCSLNRIQESVHDERAISLSDPRSNRLGYLFHQICLRHSFPPDLKVERILHIYRLVNENITNSSELPAAKKAQR